MRKSDSRSWSALVNPLLEISASLRFSELIKFILNLLQVKEPKVIKVQMISIRELIGELSTNLSVTEQPPFVKAVGTALKYKSISNKRL